MEAPTSPRLLEAQYVHQPYRNIAQHVVGDAKLWPNVRQFILNQPVDSLIADIGCGNGKYFNVTRRVFMVGSDICAEIASQAVDPFGKSGTAIADTLSLPFRDDSFDALISVAVLHHLSTENRRRRAMEELARVVQKGGKLMIYVWALEQTQREFSAQDILVPWLENGGGKKDVREEENEKMDQLIDGSLRLNPLKENNNQQDRKEEPKSSWLNSVYTQFLKPIPAKAKTWNNESSSPVSSISYRGELVKGVSKWSPMLGRKLASALGTPTPETLNLEQTASALALEIVNQSMEEYTALRKGGRLFRFYHVFKEGELAALVGQVPSLKIIRAFYDHANWCVIAEKI